MLRLGGSNVGIGGAFDFDANTYTVALVSSTYALTADKLDTDEFVDPAILPYEISGGNYARQNLVNPTWTYVDDTLGSPGNTVKFNDAGDAATTFTNLTNSFRYAVLFKNTGSNSTSPLVMVVDFESTQASSSSNFVISWSTSGIFRLRAVHADLGG
jgi:hypothetical protein